MSPTSLLSRPSDHGQESSETSEFTDDLDGSAATGTVSLRFDGAIYEIDLNEKNKTAMEKAIKPYVEHARRVRITRTRRTARASTPRHDLSAIRAWAKDKDYSAPDRGRVCQEIADVYTTAH